MWGREVEGVGCEVWCRMTVPGAERCREGLRQAALQVLNEHGGGWRE